MDPTPTQNPSPTPSGGAPSAPDVSSAAPKETLMNALKKEIEKDAATPTPAPTTAISSPAPTTPIPAPSFPKEDWSDALKAVEELKPKGSDKLLADIQKEAAAPKTPAVPPPASEEPYRPPQPFMQKKAIAVAGVRNVPAPQSPIKMPADVAAPALHMVRTAPSETPVPLPETTGETQKPLYPGSNIPLVSISVPNREGLKPEDIQVKKIPVIPTPKPAPGNAPRSAPSEEPATSLLSPTQQALLAKLKGAQKPVTQKNPSSAGDAASSEAKEAVSAPDTAAEQTAQKQPEPEPLVTNIRTFKSDLQHTLVKQQTSVVSAISAEENRRAKRPRATTVSKVITIERRILTIASIILILGGIGTVAYVFIGTRGIAPETTIAARAPIFTEATRTIDVSAFNREALLNNLTIEKETAPLTLGGVAQLYLYQKGLLGSSELTTQEFMRRINSRLSDTGQRALSKQMFLGVHAFDGNQPFIIVETEYYESAYAEMLAWEDDMQSDLSPLFGDLLRSQGNPVVPDETDTATTTVATSTSTTTDTGGGNTPPPPTNPPGGSTGSTTGGTTTSGTTTGGGNTTGSTTGGTTTGGTTGGGSTTGGTTGGTSGTATGGTTGGTTGGGSTTGGTTGGTSGGSTTGGTTTGGTTGGGSTTGGTTTGGGSTGGSSGGAVLPPPPPPPPPGAWWWPSLAHAQTVPPATTTASASTTSSTVPSIDTSYLRRFIPVFVDAVVKNYDVRELKDANGTVVLLYGFPFRDTLIITTNEYTFVEAVTRLINERQ